MAYGQYWICSTSNDHTSLSNLISSLCVSISYQLIKQLVRVSFSCTLGTALRNICSGSGRLNESGGAVRYCQMLLLLAAAIRSFRRCRSFPITFSCTA